MWDLDFTKYSPVFCQFEPVSTWLVNPALKQEVIENAHYLKELSREQRQHPTPVAQVLRRYDFSLSSSIKEDEALRYLGFRSFLPNTDSFQSQSQFDESRSRAEMILATERFFGPRPLSIGASRHALLKTLEAKGVGQNSLNIAYDYAYQSGGLKSYNAFHALYAELAAQERCEIAPLSTAALLQYQHQRLDGSALSVHLRSAKTYRLSAVWAPSLGSREREHLKKFVINHFKTSDPAAILERLVSHFVLAFTRGVYHATPSLSNLTLTGEWIDTESLVILPEKRPAEAYLEVLRLQGRSEVLVFDSWIHNLYSQCQHLAEFYQALFPELRFELDQKLLSLLQHSLSMLDVDWWWKLLKNHQSWRMLNFAGEGHEKLSVIAVKDFAQFTPRESHSYATSFGSGEVQRWVENPADRTYQDFLSKMSKVFLLFQESSGGFAEASERFERLKEMVRDHL